jgi:hypothetical protein
MTGGDKGIKAMCPAFWCQNAKLEHNFKNKIPHFRLPGNAVFLLLMSTKYKFRDQDKLYFVSFSVVNWIDLFIRNEYKNIILESWKHCQKYKGLEIYGWCIMSSHIHMVIGTHGEKLENIMRDMKKHTSTALKQAIKDHPAESRRE